MDNLEILRAQLAAKEAQAEVLLTSLGITKTDHNFSVAMSLAALALLAIDFYFGMNGVAALTVTAFPLVVDIGRKLYSSLVKKA